MSSQYRKNELKKPVPPKKKKAGRQADAENDASDNEEGEVDDDKEEIEGEEIEQDDEADKDADKMIQETLRAIPTIDVAVGKFVYVGCDRGIKASHFAGQITKVTPTEVDISVLSKSRNTYMWPSPLISRTVDADDIHLELEAPSLTHRDHLVFYEKDMSAMNLCCSH